MPVDLSKLITIDGLTTFKQGADAKYETKENVSTLAGRVTALENDDSAANTIETVKVNGTALVPDAQKAVDVVVPTTVAALADAADYAKVVDLPTKLSDLANDNDTVTDAAYVHTDNNFTAALKAKLEGVEDGAQANDIETIQVNGVAQVVTGKAVDITVTEGTANGTVKVAGTDVAVHGLGSAAYADASDLGDDNVIETVKVNGTALTPDANKAVNVTVPTAVSQLSDAASYALVSSLGTAAAKDSEATLTDGANLPTGAAVKAFVEGKGYQDATGVAALVEAYGYATEDYCDGAIATALGSVYTVKGSVASHDALPSSGQRTGDVYNVVAAYGDTPAGTNYVWNGSAWDALGGAIDLSGYVLASSLGVATTAEIQALFA